MRRLFVAAATYAGLGLAAGLFYREYTKLHGFTGDTQLTVMHTHLLALGMLFMLVVLALDAVFRLDGSRSFSWFFTTYNAGMVLTVAMLGVRGVLQVNGVTDVSAAIPGLAGLGHILLLVGILCFFVSLSGPLREFTAARAVPHESNPAIDTSPKVGS
ncbi:MAG: DUF2871 domain-containing protein [Pseudonocardia sp.]|nr:DUF2871 domain-containing protein [Pseudonocardia sp.]